ncbi:hypothetical protein [Streptomyces sp. NPDC048192]|uniref:hypothetical protein n=1 Tax=Streptomyces sp. NPDC048192 TaxID=3365510 RepID=UPI0037227285
MADVWVLYESAGGMASELFRADAIDYLHSNDQQVDVRIGTERTTLLHVSGRPKLPAGFGLDLLKTIARTRAEQQGKAVDTLIVPTLDGETWTWEPHPLLDY